MKITIDTNSDSKEDIRKAVRLLLALIGANAELGSSESSQRNIFDSPSSTVEPGAVSEPAPQGNIFGGLFDSDASKSEIVGETSEPAETSSTEETPDVEMYE